MKVRLLALQWREPGLEGNRAHTKGETFDVSSEVGAWLIRSGSAVEVQPERKPRPRKTKPDE